MKVEDGLELLAKLLKVDDYGIQFVDAVSTEQNWDLRFVTNVVAYIRKDKPLSTEQSKIVLKMLKRFERKMVVAELVEEQKIRNLIEFPTYRHTPYTSASVPREVRYIGDNCLAFRFKMNDVIKNDIKRLRPKGTGMIEKYNWFHSQHRVWVVPVTRDTIKPVQELISKHRFGFDDEVVEYLVRASNSLDQPAGFAVDPEVGLISAEVGDNELIAWWVQNVLNGEVV
jgi:predicted nucleic acid-binding protein